MKFKGLALLGLIPALFFCSIAPATADVTPSPSPTSSASSDFATMMDQYKVNLDKYRNLTSTDSQMMADQYRAAVDMFRILKDSREELRSQINRSFMASVDKANKEARTAMKMAKSASAKNDVISKQKTAITAASDARDSAIAALGALPTPPLKPLKQVEPQPLNKVKTKKASPSPTSDS